jgi:hypothetical protein
VDAIDNEGDPKLELVALILPALRANNKAAGSVDLRIFVGEYITGCPVLRKGLECLVAKL